MAKCGEGEEIEEAKQLMAALCREEYVADHQSKSRRIKVRRTEKSEEGSEVGTVVADAACRPVLFSLNPLAIVPAPSPCLQAITGRPTSDRG